MSHIDTTAFRFKLRGETAEQLAARITMWSRIQASSDHASQVRAMVLALTRAEISRRASPRPDTT